MNEQKTDAITIVYISPEPLWADLRAIVEAIEDIQMWFGDEMSGDTSIVTSGEFENWFVQLVSRVKNLIRALRRTREKPQLNLVGPVWLKFNPAFFGNNPPQQIRDLLEQHGFNQTFHNEHPKVYVCFVRGLGGFAGTTVTEGQARLAIISDAVLDAITGHEEKTYSILNDVSMSTRDAQVGAIVHELVIHGLGWGPHTDLPDTSEVSMEWWDWPNSHLTIEQKEHLKTFPWRLLFSV